MVKKAVSSPVKGKASAVPVEFAPSHELLLQVMEAQFFEEVTPEHLSNILPLLFNIESQTGIRNAEIGGYVYMAYLLDDETNTTVSSRMMRRRSFNSVAVYESAAEVAGKKLVIEIYRLITCKDAPAAISFEELKKAYTKKFKSADSAALKEIYGRLNWCCVGFTTAERLADMVHKAIKIQHNDYVEISCEKTSSKELTVFVSRIDCTDKGHLYERLADIAFYNGFRIKNAGFCMVSKQADVTDFKHLSVQLGKITVVAKEGDMKEKQIKTFVESCKLVDWVEVNDLFQSELVAKGRLDMMDANLMRAVAEFVHSQLSYVDRNNYLVENVYRYMARYPMLLAELAAAFHAKFDPASPKAGKDFDAKKIAKSIASIATGISDKDRMIKTIFSAALDFLVNIRLTNFFSGNKAALAFRLDPAFMNYYASLTPAYCQSFPSDRPYGVFFFYRQETVGFHVRFGEIARGGWRSVVPKFGASALERFDNYDYAKNEVFREVYVLAHTQHLKNKDIYEGGAKMITLLKPTEAADFKPYLWENQRSVCAAFLSLIDYDAKGKLKDKQIVDTQKQAEIVEIGPDENMFDTMIEWMGEYAAECGYTLGSGLISGKPGSGINHKEYGVTSYGVFQYLLKTVSELGINAEKDDWTVKISGGPFGDVAGNLMLLLNKKDAKGKYILPKLKIVGIVDGPAAVYDPAGMDREAISAMLFTKNLDAYAPELLRGEGAYMVFTKPTMVNGEDKYRLVKVVKGKLTEHMVLRDEFMRTFQGTLHKPADIFVPCGGRPSTINDSNVMDFCPEGKNSSRAIVEGANSFITPGARVKLQERGIWIVKDASANKCGVITSSYEILTGLMLSDAEFKKFHKEVVAEVMEILKKRATDEANWLYEHFRRTGTPMTELTEKLSRAINAKNDEIKAYLAKHPEAITDAVLFSHLPAVLVKKFPERLSRIPLQYRIAIASVELASRVIYQLGGNVEKEINAVL